MSVVGIDLGCLNTVVAVARNRGVDVIVNEVSNRKTPSLVAFGPKQRYLGEPAKTQEISNLKNTVGCLKRIVGRTFNDSELDTEKLFITAELAEVNGEVGAKVKYLGQDEKFSATQLTAMLLSKIKATAAAELKAPVSDVVISVPAWFTDKQRRSLIDAADIAGLKLLRLINDTTAAALGYGITKTDLPLPEEKPRRVAFVDMGYSNYTVSIVQFSKGELKVVSTADDRHLGGRHFDKALADHFAEEFKTKYKIDVLNNAKAYQRLLAGVEKLKKVLSANAQAPLNIESIMPDIDVSSMMKREDFEELVAPLLERVHAPLKQALAEANLAVEDIDTIELVGGCVRIPAIKDTIQNFFNKPLSFTLNQDEAIARGCAFACAILSPAFRVRDFSVHDIVPYPIEFTWEQSQDIPDEDTSLTVFNKGNSVPSTKILTFYRKESFDLEARYADPSSLPGNISPWIGKFSVKGVKPDERGDFMICKLKARVNLFGVLNVESGHYVEEVEVEEEIKEEGDAMETDESAPKKTRKVKKAVKKGDLPVVGGNTAIDLEMKRIYHERELEMGSTDKLVMDTSEKKNALEGYIYELRSKLDGQLAPFASEDEKSRLNDLLLSTEDWLYTDEGEEASKGVYQGKIDEIKSIAAPIGQRFFDAEEEKRQAQLKRNNNGDAERKAAEAAAKMREAQKDVEMGGQEEMD